MCAIPAEFARNLCLAIARGEDFLGKPTRQGECVYLALEERANEVRADFEAMGADGAEPILVHAAATPAEGMFALVEMIRERKPRLVVIDPLFRLARVKDESAYAETYAALGPLIDIARETGTHLHLTHHSGKGLKTDAIDAPLGSTAIGGAVCTLVVLKRTESYRTIQTVQRVGTDMSETVLQYNSDTYQLSLGGAKSDADRRTCETRILEFLRDAAEAQTQAQIRDAVEGQTKVIRAALTTLAGTGKVVKLGDGTKGKPFLYEFPNSGSQHSGGTSEPESCEGKEEQKTFRGKFWDSGSHALYRTSEPESEKVARARIDTGAILVPENLEKPILVPEREKGEL